MTEMGGQHSVPSLETTLRHEEEVQIININIEDTEHGVVYSS